MLLIKKGANINVTNNNGKTALDLAVEKCEMILSCNQTLIKYLKSHGAVNGDNKIIAIAKEKRRALIDKVRRNVIDIKTRKLLSTERAETFLH